MPSSSGSSESNLQSFIHALEQGRFAGVIRIIAAAAVVLAIAFAYLGLRFRGFAAPEAMDQAQIAREVARGHGWSTLVERPLALWQFDHNKLPPPGENFPDTFHAPLPPLVNALAVKLSGDKMEFARNEYIAGAERLIVALSMLCFLASVGVQFLLLRRLFDSRLAFFTCALTLVSDLCWQLTLTGLPYMLMLLLFNAALYAVVRALQVHRALERGTVPNSGPPAVPSPVAGKPAEAATPGKVQLWMAVAGVLFGLLALSHAITIWLFAGALIYCAVHFRKRGPVVLILLLTFTLVYAPWLARNYRVSGNPFGVSGYEVFDGLSGTTTDRMRNLTGPKTEEVQPHFFRVKVQRGVRDQLGDLAGSLGSNVIALAFFLGLVHVFRRQEVNHFRWALLLMWALAVVGMGVAGPGTGEAPNLTGPNQIGVLFLPTMLGFGLAYILVLFSRRETSTGPLARIIFYFVLFVMSALPMIFTLLPSNNPMLQYPPYLQPGINLLGKWTKPNEVIASDMPWAVAWYADRKSLWIPNKLKEFTDLNDSNRLPGPLAGVFLTQISRNTPLFGGVLKGEYAEYQALILGRTDVPFFPFREMIPSIGDPTAYLFFSDSKRWEKEAASKEANK